MGSKQSRSAKVKPKTTASAGRRLLWHMIRGVLIFGVIAICASVLLVGSMRWMNPPITGVMLQRKFEAANAGQATALNRRWCSLSELGANLPRAVIASEDQRFVDHHGFDLIEIENALEDAWQGEGLRGASTISQQVAKNVFLTTHRSWMRKGLEVWFTALVEAMWSKQRILEVHLNVAEWGPGLFGACAASEFYFSSDPVGLNRQQAALMAVTLPAPLSRRPDQPGSYSSRRAQWVLSQMPNVEVPGS